jgi:glycosyltransferase involved in cell wall biosynthesis
MYRRADMIVSVTDSFVQHFLDRGIPREKIAVIKNGADLDAFTPGELENCFRRKHGLGGKFVVSYVGTHGMAHGLDTVLKAAEMLRGEMDIVFLLVGDGAERENLLRLKQMLGLPNVLMLPQLEKALMPQVLAASDVSLVHLRKADLFKSVIPSKIFEAMAMERPIILGVEGESRGIVEAAGCGVCIEPGNAGEMAEAVLALRRDRGRAETLGKNGKRYVAEHFDRNKLAERYLSLLMQFERLPAATGHIHRQTDIGGKF